MYTGHPYVCTERKFPTTCNRCNQVVVYWECYHGSKVFFDSHGQHGCSPNNRSTSGTSPLGPRPSGRIALETLTGVSESIQPENYDLLPGMARLKSAIAADLARVRRGVSDSQQRNTVSVPAYEGSHEYLIGDVSDIFDFYLPTRFGLSESSVLAIAMGRIFPGLQVTQITILIDEILNDPDVMDVWSYTVWCPAKIVPAGLVAHQSVSATISSIEFLSIGNRWVVESIERL